MTDDENKDRDELYKVAFPDPRSKRTLVVNVSNCARCGGNHGELEFIRLQRMSGEHTHWAFCPATGEPILLKTRPTDDNPAGA